MEIYVSTLHNGKFHSMNSFTKNKQIILYSHCDPIFPNRDKSKSNKTSGLQVLSRTCRLHTRSLHSINTYGITLGKIIIFILHTAEGNRFQFSKIVVCDE